jgi:hypothetical protein
MQKQQQEHRTIPSSSLICITQKPNIMDNL